VKTALITDLHANREAVESVMAHASEQGAQQWAFLGDFVGYGADPAWVIDLVRDHVARGAVVVQGNHDLATVLGANPMMRIEARAVIEWTRAQLDASQLEFLRTLPMSERRENRLYVHANAYAPDQWEYLLNANLALRSMLATECRYTFCGHLHEQRLFHAGETGRAGEYVPRPGAPIMLRNDRRWLDGPAARRQPGSRVRCVRRCGEQHHVPPCRVRPRVGRRQDPWRRPAAAAGGAAVDRALRPQAQLAQ
jgi:predicted phosphodiesterase